MASQDLLERISASLEDQATKEDIKLVVDTLNSVNDKLMKRLEILEGRVFSLEGENDNLRQEVKRLEKNSSSLQGQLDQQRKEGAVLRAALNDQEQHGRAWNVRVHGVPEQKGGGETVDACIKKCVDVFSQKVGVPVTVNDIEIAHRTGKPGGPKPRPIIARFFSRQKKGLVIMDRKKLKNSGVSVSEDLTRANYQLLTRAGGHSAVLAAWSSHGKVLAKTKNGKVIRLDINSDVDTILTKAMV